MTSLLVSQVDYDPFQEHQVILRSLLRAHRAVLATKPPKCLHHYTGPSGLLGILESTSLFLSDTSFLNDQSEIVYARDLTARVLSDLSSSADDEHGPLLQTAARRFLASSDVAAGLRYYVACFCENANLLSQWRGYGQPGSGCSIALTSSRIDGVERFPGDPPVALRKVIYKRDVQERIVVNAVEAWKMRIPKMAKGASRSAESNAKCVTALALALYTLMPQFKHPLLQEEREWRLVYIRYGTPEDLLFRQNNVGIVPYLSVNIAEVTGSHVGRLPLEGITHAPSQEPDVHKRALRELLRAKGYPDPQVTIEGSDIPLRSV